MNALFYRTTKNILIATLLLTTSLYSNPVESASCDIAPNDLVAGDTVTCSGPAGPEQTYQVHVSNVTLINNGNWSVTGQMPGAANTGVLGPHSDNPNMNRSGLKIINNGTVEWLNALPRTETFRYALGLGTYYVSYIDENMELTNNGTIRIHTDATNFSLAAGMAMAARYGFVRAINTGSIHVDNSVVTSSADTGGIVFYGGGTNALIYNSGDIYVDAGAGGGSALEYVSGGSYTAADLRIENTGTVYLTGNTSAAARRGAIMVTPLDHGSASRYANIDIVNSGLIEARDYNGDLSGAAIYANSSNIVNTPIRVHNTSTGVMLSQNTVQFVPTSLTHLDLRNEGEMTGNIITANGADIIRQLSGHITGDINLGGGDDVFAMSGGYFDGSLFMGDGDDEAVFSTGADMSKILLLDGGAGANRLNFNGVHAKAYTDTLSDITKGVNVQSWANINLNNSTMDLMGNLFSAGNEGTLTVGSGSLLNNTVVGNATIFGNLNNSGIIQQMPAGFLRVTGDYIGGSSASLMMDTLTPQSMIIHGNATGVTSVFVKNLGIMDPDTVNGMEVIDVHGASSNTAFIQGSRIVAGEYDFTLVKGNADQTDPESWYLTGHALEPWKEETEEYNLRPEIASYIANIAAANTMFVMRLEDRKGDSYYYDPVTGQVKSTSVWMRYKHADNRFNDNSGEIRTKSRYNIMQIGGDVARWEDNAGINKLRAGLMAGYGKSNGNSMSRMTGHASDSTVDGYHIGAYATWFSNKNAAENSGFRLDSWLNWNSFNAETHGDDMEKEKYKMNGITASVEAGYLARISSYADGFGTWIEPQAQMVWMGVTGDENIDQVGVRVTGYKKNLQSRLGLKTHLYKPDNSVNPEGSAISPYVAINWINNNKPFSAHVGDTEVIQSGVRNITELKFGFEGRLNRQAHLWANLAKQFGSDNYRDTYVQLGAKWHF